jgi:hypothetical protein
MELTMKRTGPPPLAEPNVKLHHDGRDIFVIFNGLKIAKRGRPGTPDARRWVSIEPGYDVRERAGTLEVSVKEAECELSPFGKDEKLN